MDAVNENMATPMWWGKGKGCDFLVVNCTESRKYEEFPADKSRGLLFGYDGWGSAYPDGTSDKCPFMRISDNCGL